MNGGGGGGGGGAGGGDSTQQQPQQHQHHHHQQQQWIAMHQYQQQLMAMQMQYPASVMMHPNMIYGGQHYMPGYYQQHHMYQQHQQHQQQQQSQQQHQQQQQGGKQNHQIPISSEDNRTIWIGDLQQWMDETYLQNCFAKAGEVQSVKVIRNKQTGQSERYGFIEFSTHDVAETVLQSINGTPMPDCQQDFRLNWSAFSMGNKRVDEVSDLSIFVGDLAPDVTDAVLLETFASRYPSVTSAKVVVDTNTSRSKGYGFVRFGDENEKTRSMTEMNGEFCSSRPMRIGVATPKKPGTQQQYASQAVILSGGHPSNGSSPHGYQSDGDSSNTTIFVGGLDAELTDDELKQSFIVFGEVVSVKIPPGKGCGFVQFSNRSSAEEAIQNLNGTVIGKNTVRLSWGRNQVSRQLKTDYSNQRNGGGYGRQGGFNGNGHYAAAAAVAANGDASSNGHVNHQPAATS